jgi:lipoprotein NlpD
MMLRTLPKRLLPLVTSVVATLVVAGCTSVSLKEQPQVVDWSRSGSATVTPVQPQPAAAVLYTVRRQDTLESVAARFNTTPANLAAWNNLGPNPKIRPDQVLRVTAPDAPAPVDTGPVATTQPIVTGGIEARPLGGVTSAPLAPSTPATTTGDAPLKSGPLGLKQPYSDAALADLSRPDGSTPAAAPPVVPPPVAPPVAQAAAPTLSWAWPTAGRPARGFDEKTKGVDIAGKAGDPVLAAADGRVTYSGVGVRGYGNFVIIQHTGNVLSVYAHNRKNLVAEGATVTKGQAIAEMGNTESDAVKLHFEIRRDGNPVDPLQYLPAR